MKVRVSFAAIAVAASLGMPAFAQASDIEGPQGYGPQRYAPGPYGALPPYEVITIIRSMGFNPQSRPVLRGRVYVIHASDEQGILVRVAVDANSGRVLRVIERTAGAGFGPLPPDRYGAYPVPPSSVPGDSAYEEPDERAPDYGAQDYRAPASNAYPRPIYPQSSTQPPGATAQPRVATRTPPVAPTPRARPQAAPATQATVTPPQGAAVKPSAPATTSSIEDSGRPGKSIPAPVASRKAAPEDSPAAKPDTSAKPDTPAKSADPALVPVAPLE